MSDCINQLWAVYQQWKLLTEREGAAIGAGDWAEVHQAQEEKRGLRSSILHLTDEVQKQFGSDREQESFARNLRGIVNELILLETRNNATLQGSIEQVTEQRRDLDKTSNRLRKVHSRYVPNRSPVWQNFS